MQGQQEISDSNPACPTLILSTMQHCLLNVMLTRHFILYINIHRTHKIEWFSKNDGITLSIVNI